MQQGTDQKTGTGHVVSMLSVYTVVGICRTIAEAAQPEHFTENEQEKTQGDWECECGIKEEHVVVAVVCVHSSSIMHEMKQNSCETEDFVARYVIQIRHISNSWQRWQS